MAGTGPLDNQEDFCVDGQRVRIQSSENLRFLERESVDFFITSPPYWNLKDYGVEGQIGGEDYEAYLGRLDVVWGECYEAARNDAVLAINIGNRRHKKRYYPIGMDIASRMQGWELWDTVIWYVPNALPQPNHYMERLFDNKFEFVLIFTKDGSSDYKFHKPRVPQKYAVADPRPEKKNAAGRCIGNVVRVPAYKPPNVKKLGYHVAAYPEELVALFLQAYTDEGDTVVDPFLGSGTTLKVCRGMKRRGIGTELNPDFGPLIQSRIMEPFEIPDWKDVDILHSSSNLPGRTSPRKIHLMRGHQEAAQARLAIENP